VFIENHDTDRFASDVGGDPRKERIGAALDVLLEGTPLIYYGQEIGMRGKQTHEAGIFDGNDIPDREAFRWSRRVEAPGSAIWYKGTGPWWTRRYAHDDDGISVEEQRGDSNSLLAFYRRLLALRRARAELVTGDERVVGTDQPKVLAVLRDAGAAAGLILVNLSDSSATVTVAPDSLPAGFTARPLADLLTGWAVPAPAADGALRVELAPWSVSLVAQPAEAAAPARPRRHPR